MTTLPSHIYGTINDMLTPSDKVTILLNAGLSSGRASTIAAQGPADFWAALANQGNTVDPATWHRYPACWSMIWDACKMPKPSLQFTTDHIYGQLNLGRRLSQEELLQVAHWLYRNAPSDVRRFFNPEFFSGDAKKVLQQATNSMLSVDMVADAIDRGAGKANIAHGLRALCQSATATSSAPAPPSPAATTMMTDPVQAPSNAFAQGFESAAETATAASFIRDTDNMFLQKICMALNETDTYPQLLQLFSVQPTVESSRRLAELRERWLAGRFTGKRGNPALSILTDLCASDKFAAQPLTELAGRLMKASAAEVQAAVAGWITASADSQKEIAGAIQASVDQHVELREFFLSTKLAANTLEAQEHIDRLTSDDIDVHTLMHLRDMTADELRSAGFSLRLSKSIVMMVKQHFGAVAPRGSILTGGGVLM